MALNNNKLKRDLQKIAVTLKKNINYKDFRSNPTFDTSFEIEDGDSIFQAFKMWVFSTKTDYTRIVNKSGFFYNALREYIFSDDSIPLIKEDITTAAKEMFPTINLISLEVRRDVNKRSWIVSMGVQDEITGLFSLNEELKNIEISIED